MAVLQQMGNDSRSLLGEVPGFAGAIASPVNDGPDEVTAHVQRYRSTGFRFIFDPQLYSPKSERGKLRTWSYFPADVDTSDTSAPEWWVGVGRQVLGVARELGVDEICTPINIPTQYSDDFYAATTESANALADEAGGFPLLQTILVKIEELATKARALEIASIVSKTRCAGAYLVFVSQVRPRLEYADSAPLKGAMRLIAALSNAGMKVTIPFCGSELPLWKAAGASRCATGKFFNLRRFTPGRWEDESKGGGQVPYWFEESLLAFLRQSDLLRVRERGLIQLSQPSTFGQQILEQLETAPADAWIALSWRHFMSWFADFDARVDAGLDIAGVLERAEANWQTLRDTKPAFLLEEPPNDGRWVRPWRIALAEYSLP